MRGEDMFPINVLTWTLGSPPHARGRHSQDDTMEDDEGITLACAGKTTTRTCTNPTSADHPRMRGEDGACSYDVPFYRRITPACAGKTQCFRLI